MISCKDPKFAEVFPRPVDSVPARLAHVLALYADSPDELEMVIGTVNAYEQGCVTALTLGDLRKLEILTATASQEAFDEAMSYPTGPDRA